MNFVGRNIPNGAEILAAYQELAFKPYYFADMLKDDDRNMKYFKGIESAIDRMKKRGMKAIVLDIGCGTGLLSLMAHSAKADKIYACDDQEYNINCCKKVFTLNRCRVNSLMCKRSTSLEVGKNKDMAEKANILITEIFDSELIGEGVLATINDAKERLLEKDYIIVPQKGILYAQVVDCPMFRDLNILNPIKVTESSTLQFPESIKYCSDVSNADYSIQLGALKRSEFKKISDSIAVFEFDWRCDSPLQPDCSSISFVANCDGEANTIFSWFELDLGDYGTEDRIIITCRPWWAGESNPVWRYHWSQSVYNGFTPIELKKNNVRCLESYRNDTQLWFKITNDQTSIMPEMLDHNKPLMCRCGFHQSLAISSHHFALMNDEKRNKSFSKLFGKCIVPNETTCLCMGDSSIILPMMAIAFGAKAVFILQPLNSEDDLTLLNIKRLLSGNNLSTDVHVLRKNSYQLTCRDFGGGKLDMVFGEPCYKSKDLLSRPNHKAPWYHLKYWQQINSILPSLKSKSFKTIPEGAKLMGIAVNFNFDRPFTAVGRVCDGKFDQSPFTTMILKPFDPKKPAIVFEEMWQYKSVSTSLPFTISEWNFNEDLQLSRMCKNVKLEQPTNAFVFWVDWILGDDEIITSGLLGNQSIGQDTNWCRYFNQGIIFTNKFWNGVARVSASFEGNDPASVKFSLNLL